MAVVFMEGFDHIALAQLYAKGWSQPSGGSVVAGRFAGQGLRTNSSAPNCYSKALPASYSTLIVGFAFLPTTTDARDVLSLRNGTTTVVKVATVVVGGVPVVRLVNASGTTLATGTTGVPANAWTYIELKVVVSATVGTVEVRLNGASAAECSGTGLNTGALDIDNIGLWWVVTYLNTYDDIYVVDTSGSAPTNTWLGEVRVSTLIPNGNGANTAWTGAYTDWDDITSADDDTTYVSSSTPGDRETSTLTDLSAATSTVLLSRPISSPARMMPGREPSRLWSLSAERPTTGQRLRRCRRRTSTTRSSTTGSLQMGMCGMSRRSMRWKRE